MKRLYAIASLLLSQAALAAWPGLPPDEAVAHALRAHPDTLAASSEVNYEIANRQRLEAGTYEWNVRLGGQRRNSTPAAAADQRFNEWNVAVERPFRLPGKAETDGEIGSAGVRRAETALSQAIHENKRELLQGWFAWLRESAIARQWATQVELLERQRRAVVRRQQLGDAARSESIQAEAAAAQARVQAQQAQARRQSAREILLRRYPALPLGEPPTLAEPPDGIAGMADWPTLIAEHSPDLALARQQSELARLAAHRQRQERLPDPSVGIAYARERGGEEQVVGAYVSIPLAGRARQAAEQGAAALADAATYREAAIARRVALETATAVQAAEAAQAAWQASRLAADRLQEVADMAGRAYRLGEGSLNEWLTALRLANEARLAALTNQLEALEKSYRLMLDGRRLWGQIAQ